MKLWIIYKCGSVFLKLIAEMLQDRLESFVDVSVGVASKIDPSLIVKEGLDYLIIGDIIEETIPSLEIQNWILKYGEILEGSNRSLVALSGFLILADKTLKDPSWCKFIHENIVKETIIFPPILHLKLNESNLAFYPCLHGIIKDYSSKIIEFITKKANMT
jgi:hypothetical protein